MHSGWYVEQAVAPKVYNWYYNKFGLQMEINRQNLAAVYIPLIRCFYGHYDTIIV